MRCRWDTVVGLLAVVSVSSVLQAEDLWQAGAGRVKITPGQAMWMAGYGSRAKPAEGKVTDLWAKALVLDDGKGNRGVVVSLDLVGIDREIAGKVCTRLKKEFGLERHQISLCTSHTHSGPVVGRNLAPIHYAILEPEQQALIDDYAERLPGQVCTAVNGAIDALAPAKVQWGNGKAIFAVNRRENKPYRTVPDLRARGALKGPVDHDVPVLSVRGEGGELRAVLFGYACHATTLSFQQWNGDYPGYAQIALEKAYPGATALFWAGCGADQNPLPRSSVELAERYGRDLARAVQDVLSSPMPVLSPSLSLRYQEIELKLQQLPTAAELNTEAQSADRYIAARARMLQKRLESQGALRGAYPYPIFFWKLGGAIDFISLGGEVVVDYALRLKSELHGKQTWVAGNTNDVMAYIPSLRVHKEGGYEGGGSNIYYGLPGLWDEGVEEAILQTVHDLSRKEN
ncbi:MAG: neutral/alkaline non-lysosomal ceramidase N-terminal domain-containing protein [Roseibacillus sp.]|nr:neutral/alkaline non-lysosomal ceramidase N-terminal domain-containing protein [Roseibacillus sp.]